MASPVPSMNVGVARLAQRGERTLAGEEAADARAVGARHVGIDLERLLDGLDRGLRIVVDEEGAAEQRDRCGGWPADEIAALGQRPVIARRQQQIFAAEPAIGARRAEIDHPAEPQIVEQAERVGRRLDHHRAFGEIDVGEEIDGVGIGGEEQRVRIHQAREDQDALIVLDACVPECLCAPRRSRRRASRSGTPRRRAANRAGRRAFCAVSSLGMPSRNLSVPSDVSTLSGVVIEGGMGA